MANATQSQQDIDPDELLNEGGGQLKEPQDLPVSPVQNRGDDQKKRMGYSPDDIQAAGGAKSAIGKGLGGSIPGADAAKGGIDPASMAADKLGKGLEKNKGETEKKVDKAAGKATEAAVTAATGGTGTGTVATVAGKVVEKVGTKRIAIIGGIAIITPIVIIGFFISYLLSGGAWDAISKVLTDKKTREFGLTIAENWGKSKGVPSLAIDIAKKFNEVSYEQGSTAIAAGPVIKPEAGSFEEKMQSIDWEKAQYQTLSRNDCRYDLQLQKVVNAEGRVRSIPKDVLDKQTGKTTPIQQLDSNTTAGFCIQQKYPIFNLFFRQPTTREINKKSDLYLSYAAPKDSPQVQGSNAEVDKYVYDKTLKRITSAEDKSVNLGEYKPLLDNISAQYRINTAEYNAKYPNEKLPVPDAAKDNVVESFAKMYNTMAEGTSPYDMQVQEFFNVPTMETPTHTDDVSSNVAGTGLAEAICPFLYTFADIGPGALFPETGAKNAKAAIESRLTGAQRGSTKNLTLADTRKADALSSSEANSTIQQVDNWASSVAYQLDVYNKQTGVQMNPEGTQTRAYNAKQQVFVDDGTNPNSPLHRLKGACYVIGRRGLTIDIGSEAGKTVDPQRGVQANKDMVDAFQDLKKEIFAQSNGIFASPTEFGIEQVMTGFIRTGSVTAVSGLEPGPDNFNRQSMGYRQLTNDYNLAIGARFLTPLEAQELAIRTDNLERQQERENGIAYRLFNTNNIRSLASVFQQNTITPKTTMTAVVGNFKSLLDPLRSLADIQSNLVFFTTGFRNKAFAADQTGDAYFKVDTAGLTPEELSINPQENATIIENIKKGTNTAQKEKFAHYDECFTQKIPSSQYFQISDNPILDASGKVTGYKRFFTYFPEKSVDLNTNKIPVTNDPNSEFNKFSDCQFLMQGAKDLKDPNQLLAIRYRLYRYYNNQLDLMAKLSSEQSDTSIFANSGSGSSAGGTGGTNPGGFILPTKKENFVISQCWKEDGKHPGIDLGYTKPDPEIYAVADGTAVIANGSQDPGGYGNMVYIKHSDSLFTLYAHNKELKIHDGDQVKQGQLIAIGGTTGYSTGPHLHFEVRTGPYATQSQHNPVFYIPELNDAGGKDCKTGIDEVGRK